jgi:GNAT superfamily N-acetyltransferase
MSGLEIHPFGDEHLDASAELLAERHRRHHAAEPLLSERRDFREEVEALRRVEGASGVAGTRGGRVVGYILGIPKSDGIWGPNVWVDPAGHAAEEPEDVRDLYAAVAADWVGQGRTRHYVMAPASDEPLLDAWNRLGFGQQQALAVRELPATTPRFDGVRVAEAQDIDTLIELAPLLSDHQESSPVFSSGPRYTEKELRAEITEDLANPEIGNLVAEVDGRIVGNFVVAPTELSSTHAGLARLDGAPLLAYALTRPDVRGSGAGLALTHASFAWAKGRGYETMVTDWRVTNLLSSRFWPKRGFRPTFFRLYRSIP